MKNLTQQKYYPWWALATGALFLFYKYILQVSPSVMTKEIMQAFHVDGAGLGNLSATFFYSYLLAQFLAGPMVDKFSTRYLGGFALMISALGGFGFSYADRLWEAEIARALMGVGAAFATVSYMKIAAMWFSANRFAFVSGLLATAAMLGALFGEMPLALLIDKTGWQHSLFYCGLLGLLIALVFFVTVRDKANHYDAEYKETPGLKAFWSLLKNSKNWYLTCYSGLAFSPLIVFGGLWGNPFLEEAYQLSKAQAASYTSLLFIGLAFGGPLFGMLADKFNAKHAMMASGTTLALVAACTVIYAPNYPVTLALGLFLFGLGTGSFMLGFAMGRDLNPLSLAASMVALINTGDAVFGAFTEPFVGKLLDIFWQGHIKNGVHYFTASEYRLAFFIIPLYLLAALSFLIPLRSKRLK